MLQTYVFLALEAERIWKHMHKAMQLGGPALQIFFAPRREFLIFKKQMPQRMHAMVLPRLAPRIMQNAWRPKGRDIIRHAIPLLALWKPVCPLLKIVRDIDKHFLVIEQSVQEVLVVHEYAVGIFLIKILATLLNVVLPPIF